MFQLFKGLLCEGEPEGAAPNPPAPVPVPPVATPPVPPAGAAPLGQQPKKGWTPDDNNPALKERLAQKESSVLKDLGFESKADAQRKLARLKELETAQLTDAEKQSARVKELETQVASAAPYQQRFEAMVTAQFAALPETHQQWVDSRANGDPILRDQWMSALRDLQALQAPPVPIPATPPAGAAPPSPPPAQRPASAGNGGPPPPPRTGAQSAFEKWDALTDPLQKQFFYRANQRAIEDSRPS